MGRGGGFGELDSSIQRLGELSGAGRAPGRTADWNELEARASAVLQRRGDVESLNAAAGGIATGAADLVKEGMILSALSQADNGSGHPNIIQLRGWTPTGRMPA